MASIFIRTLIIYLFLSISIKCMGKRQLGELEVGELVSTLVISEVAALPIADPDIPLMNAVIPVLFIVCLEIIISYLKNKSARLKKAIDGEPAFIIYKGRLLQKALRDNRISLNELLSELRIQGFGDITEVSYAILEHNGKISAFKSDDAFSHPVIIDTATDEDALSLIGKNEEWLKKLLKKKKAEKDEVFLLTVDKKSKTNLIKKELE